MKKIENYYDDHYFNYHQRKIGIFGAKANLFKFANYVRTNDYVLDFGCGGGYLLNNLNCSRKIGVEINPVARKVCIDLGVDCVDSLDMIQDNSIDLILSNNCLEHTENPSKLIEQMYLKLVPGGRIVICVPCDKQNYKFSPNDINNHLYSFSPMNLGNILQNAGFVEISVKAIYHKWPPIPFLMKYFGIRIFHFFSFLYGMIDKTYTQTLGYAIKPVDLK